MADAATDTRTEARAIRLQVAGARQEESGHGIARISRHLMAQLGVTEGDVIEIVGKRETKKPDRGIVTYKHRVLNQRGETVHSMVIGNMYRCRPAAA